MANADFSKQSSAPQGFTGTSYRAAKQAEKPLTPLQHKLRKLESALPGALRTQAAAAAVLVVVMLVSVLGIGGAKLHSSYKKAADSFAAGVAEDVKSGGQYTMLAQLGKRVSTAQNEIQASFGFDGVSESIRTQAQEALLAMEQALDEDAGPAELYAADVALEAAINLLHANVQEHAPDPMQTGAEQTAFQQFASAGTTLNHLSYNDAAQRYNQTADDLLAGLVGKLWGGGKVEMFA